LKKLGLNRPFFDCKKLEIILFWYMVGVPNTLQTHFQESALQVMVCLYMSFKIVAK
jgi:hypothetical protein